MSARTPRKETIPPSISPHRAIELLKRQIERLEQTIIDLHPKDPAVEGWASTTAEILTQALGQPNGEMHDKTREFVHMDSGLPSRLIPYGGHADPQDAQRRYKLKQAKGVSLN